MTTTVTREDLQRLQGITPRLLRAFEDLFVSGAATAEGTETALTATRSIQDATVLTLSSNDALNKERVLSLDDGLLLDDGGPGETALLSLAYLIVLNGGYACTFNLEADTNLDLPSQGRVLVDPLPGPFADDVAASSGGVAINGVYRKNGGTVAWRVS